MCSRKSDGVIHDRCTHYVPSRFYDKRDCGNRFCALSQAHPRNCLAPHCECDKTWDPDHQQTILGRVPHACTNCFAYFAAAPSQQQQHVQAGRRR